MISTGSFKKTKMVFTTHNLGLLKAAERIKQQSEQKLNPTERVLMDEAEVLSGEMKASVLASATKQADKPIIAKAIEPAVIEKGVKRGGKKKSK